MQKIFTSGISKDEILLVLFNKSHKSIIKLKVVDDSSEHIKLINDICIFLKKEDIKWVEIVTNFTPYIPPNTLSYINKHNNNFVCHIEDFERFYQSNAKNYIKISHIHYNPPKSTDDGWTKVIDTNKEKKEKHTTIIQDMSILVGDWNNMN